MKTVLVTGAGGGGSNNLIRGLRRNRRALFIIGTNVDRFNLARSLADKNYLIPGSDAETEYIDALNKITLEDHVDLVIPNSDREVSAVSRHRDRLVAKILLPSAEAVEICQDKYRLHSHLSGIGMRVAKTHSIRSLEEIEEAFGYFDKGELLWCRMRKGSGSKGSLPVNDPELVRFWVRYWHEFRDVPLDSFLLSEYLPGRDYAFQSIWRNGELVIAKTCERLSYLFGDNMPSGTSSSPRVGKLVNNPVVNEICTTAVRSIDDAATGMFCVDLKEDSEGTPCITEINIGRFFMITPAFDLVGRHSFAELYVNLAFGDETRVAVNERFSDIGESETFLVREVDNEPAVLSAEDIAKSYTSLL